MKKNIGKDMKKLGLLARKSRVIVEFYIEKAIVYYGFQEFIRVLQFQH